jgi:acyl carrier protein
MIVERVLRVVSAVLGVPVSTLHSETSSDDIERWDSLGHLNLIMALEGEFGVQFSEDDLTDLTSIPLLVHEISSQLEG